MKCSAAMRSGVRPGSPRFASMWRLIRVSGVADGIVHVLPRADDAADEAQHGVRHRVVAGGDRPVAQARQQAGEQRAQQVRRTAVAGHAQRRLVAAANLEGGLRERERHHVDHALRLRAERPRGVEDGQVTRAADRDAIVLRDAVAAVHVQHEHERLGVVLGDRLRAARDRRRLAQRARDRQVAELEADRAGPERVMCRRSGCAAAGRRARPRRASSRRDRPSSRSRCR